MLVFNALKKTFNNNVIGNGQSLVRRLVTQLFSTFLLLQSAISSLYLEGEHSKHANLLFS